MQSILTFSKLDHCIISVVPQYLEVIEPNTSINFELINAKFNTLPRHTHNFAIWSDDRTHLFLPFVGKIIGQNAIVLVCDNKIASNLSALM